MQLQRCSIFLIKPQRLLFFDSVSAEVLTMAILNYASFHSLCCLRAEKLNLSNQHCFCRNNVQCQKLQVLEV